MKKKPGLTEERHKELGALLYALRMTLHKLTVELANSYPKSDKAWVKVNKAAIEIDSARSRLDSRMAREHRQTYHPSIYYPTGTGGVGDKTEQILNEISDIINEVKR